MKYKALMLDVDGTLSPYSTTALPELPTATVVDAIRAIRSRLHVGLATSRPLGKVSAILDRLQLDSFSILQNGAQIIDARTRQTIWRKAVPVAALSEVFDVIAEFKVPTFFTDFENNIALDTLNQLLAMPISSLLLDGIDEHICPQVEARLSAITGITVHKLTSKWAEKSELGVTSIEATKEKAIEHLAGLLDIAADEIIGVGDGHNDISLLRACGLKIAMGNAVPEVKAIADVIAPSVDDDGVAWVIDQYVRLGR